MRCNHLSARELRGLWPFTRLATRLAAVTAAIVGASACGGGNATDATDATTETVDCATLAPHDEFVVGLSKPGTGGHYTFALMSADPAPPSRGDNTWLLHVSSGSAPLDGATLDVDSFMPLHQHHSNVQVDITPTGTPGEYELAPVNLWMPGVWEITLGATAADNVRDEAVFKFCLPS